MGKNISFRSNGTLAVPVSKKTLKTFGLVNEKTEKNTHIYIKTKINKSKQLVDIEFDNKPPSSGFYQAVKYNPKFTFNFNVDLDSLKKLNLTNDYYKCLCVSEESKGNKLILQIKNPVVSGVRR